MLVVHYALLLEEPQEMVEAFGGFREVAGTVPLEPGNIALKDGGIQLADGIAVPVQPPAERITGAQIALDTARGISLLVEAGCQVVQVRSQRTAPQPGDHVCPDKEVVEHVCLLFPSGRRKRRRIACLDHAE